MAERQHGVVSRAQLLALGLNGRTIDYRVSIGRLLVVHRGVYAVGHRTQTREAGWMAAVLAAGPGAALSHRSAGALWRVSTDDGVTEITAPTDRRSREGLVVHKFALPPDEVTIHRGIPVTTVPRTLLDLAAVLSRRRLEAAINQAEVQRLTDALSLPDLVERHPHRKGIASLKALLADQTLGTRLTRSELERRFLHFLKGHGLPTPRTNVAVEGLEVDCVWPDARLIVELDGHATHATRRAFEADRNRDRTLSAAGWRVVRVTWRQLRDEPAPLAADLSRLVRL